MKTIQHVAPPTDRDNRFMTVLNETNERAFSRLAMSFIDDDESVVHTTLQRAAFKFGGRLPSTWSVSDGLHNARIQLFLTIRAIRTDTGTVHLTNGVNAYLVQWTALELAKEMERSLPDGASTTNRRRTALIRHHAAMTSSLGREVSSQEASDDLNLITSIVRGIRPAVRQHLIARTSDVTAHLGFPPAPPGPAGVSAMQARAFFSSEILGDTNQDRPGEERREELVTAYNRIMIHRHGFQQALRDQLLARTSDLTGDAPAAEAARTQESDLLTASVQRFAAAHPELTGDPGALLAAFNSDAITGAGMDAMRTSNAVVSPADLTAEFFPPVDMSTAEEYATPVASASSSFELIAPGENSMVAAELLKEAGKRHPGLEPLITEMLDCYRCGQSVPLTRELAGQCGLTRRELVGAIDDVRATMREIVSDFL